MSDSEKVDAEEDALAIARANFDKALQKTQAEAGGLDEVEEEASEVDEIDEDPEEEAKAPVADPRDDKILALESKLAAMSERLDSKPEAEPEPEADPYEGIEAELSEKFGEEEADVLLGALRGILDPVLKRTAGIERMIIDATERARKATATVARAKLGESYPRLKENSTAWSMVENQAKALYQKDPNKYGTPEEAFEEVAKSLYGEAKESQPDPRAEARKEAERIDASTLTEPGRKRSTRPMTADEASLASFKHLLKNPDDVAGARRIANQATKR